MAGGIDSLTAGGGDTWRKYFAEVVRGGLGDGGPGYAGFSYFSAGEAAGSQMTLAGNLKEFDINSPEGKLSIDGYGVAVASGDATTALTWRPSSAWNQTRIYFLKQPGGGSMKCYNGAQDRTLVAATDTSAAAIGLGMIDVGRGAGVAGQSFTCTDFSGKIALFGALTTLKAGVIVASWAAGGRDLAAVAAQDTTMRKAWFAEFKPTYYFLNAGTNDNGRSVPEFETNLRTIIGDIQAASPATIIYMVQPNETFNSRESYSNYFEFAMVRERVAASLGIRFVDDRTVLGNYDQAVAAGYMGDGTHPNGVGEKRIGIFLAEQAGLKSAAPDPGPTPY